MPNYEHIVERIFNDLKLIGFQDLLLLNAHSGENGHRIRLMAASKRRNRTGKKIINQVAAMVVEERSRLCDSPVNWRR
jgi:creatinine amidohydrolase/Fe(II)-dependent formamide hydrolase-like protein